MNDLNMLISCFREKMPASGALASSADWRRLCKETWMDPGSPSSSSSSLLGGLLTLLQSCSVGKSFPEG